MEPDAVKETNVGFNLVPAMLSKKVDATLGAFWNYEGVDLERRNRKPEILRMEDLGVPTYNELVFVVPPRHARRGRRARGCGASCRPRRAATSCSRTTRTRASTRCWRPTAASTAGSRPPPCAPRCRSSSRRTTSRPFGFQDPAEWNAYEQWMRANGLLTRPQGERAPLTNEFLPGEGLDPRTSGLE